MSPLETAFLSLESRDVPFVHACILELDRPIDVVALRAYMDAALVDLPRYRQRVVAARVGAAEWVTDEDFRIDRQVRAIQVPLPGNDHELEALVGQLLSTDLPRDHAPWRMYTVQGLAGGRGAVIALVHHSLVDGIAGIRMLEYLLREAPVAAREPAKPPPEPTPMSLRSLLSWKHVRSLGKLLKQGLVPASPIGLNPWHVGRVRTVASHTVPLADVHRIEDAYGVTNNDVVLATVAGALRRFVARRGIDPDRARDVRAMVPVARYVHGKPSTSGNRVALLLAPLPIDQPDPDRRLARVSSATRKLKATHIVSGGDLLVALSGVTTPQLLASVLKLALAMRGLNTIVTNVPGPRAALSLLGAKVTRFVPIVNLWPHQALGVAVASYAGSLTFGLQADRDVIPDLAPLREDLAASFAELVASARLPDELEEHPTQHTA
ncbi:MAG: wax ester/triacylglycerol synthase domain-containing protein [Acidobacteriota bacterium]